MAPLFTFWNKSNKKKIDRQNEASVCTQSNSLAHVTDIVSGKEEVVKSLVAHFKHACGKREKTRERERHEHEVDLRPCETNHTEIKTQTHTINTFFVSTDEITSIHNIQ